ncbi:MAG: sulfatase [Bacteroidetes bacterium]|nr:sulfatase [Bacteroidota bacterium]
MKRRNNIFFKTILLIVGFGLIAICSVAKEKQQPNVLFVAFDDLNDWQGCLFGHPQTYTPNINRLAEKGVLFTNAHCAGTMCCPSRASMITGLRPSTTGIYKNTDTPLDLYKNKQTLNKHFKENGYFVAGAGKILHKFYYEADDWHEYVGKHNGKDIIGNRENPEPENITNFSENIMWGPFNSPDSLTFDGKSVEWIAERINRKHDKPFFLACGIFRPHIPLFNPQKYFDQHPLEEIKLPLVKDNDMDDIPLSGRNIAYSITNFTKDDDLNNSENKEHEGIKKAGLWDDAVQAYLASVSYADAQFGRLLEALENSPYADNTIIVLWSDHGWHLGEKEHWRKATLWEEVTRVPLIIYAPNKATNSRCAQPVSLIDVYPTLIELCGLPQVEGLDGQSLVPQLENPKTKRVVPAISSLTPNFHSVRDKQFRYISYGGGQEELYDHSKDPEEWTNVANDPNYVEVKNKLKVFVPKNAIPHVKGSYNKANEK